MKYILVECMCTQNNLSCYFCSIIIGYYVIQDHLGFTDLECLNFSRFKKIAESDFSQSLTIVY